MSELGNPGKEFRQPVTEETVSLQDGPVTLYLARTMLQIVEVGRDLDVTADRRLSAGIDCLIIDPTTYDIHRETGFKALRDGREVTLGRGHQHGRFDFDRYVSTAHVTLTREGDEVTIRDLESKNGTFLVKNPGAPEKPGTTPTLQDTEPTLAVPVATPVEAAERGPALYTFAGESVPAGYRLRGEPNEDAFFIDKANRTIGVFDGVGSHEGSDAASQIAAESVRASMEKIPLVTPRGLAELAIREALEDAHDAILAYGVPEIGTTGIVGKIFETPTGEPYALIGSAGDSRAYLIRNGRIEHVTLDHVFVGLPTPQRRDIQETLAQAIDLSQLSREDRAHFNQRHTINSWLGGDRRQRPTISIVDFALEPGDQLLLTSDGIHDNLTGAEIEEAIDGAATDVAVHDLITDARKRSRDHAHDRAKPDDMTAVMVRYER